MFRNWAQFKESRPNIAELFVISVYNCFNLYIFETEKSCIPWTIIQSRKATGITLRCMQKKLPRRRLIKCQTTWINYKTLYLSFLKIIAQEHRYSCWCCVIIAIRHPLYRIILWLKQHFSISTLLFIEQAARGIFDNEILTQKYAA